MHKLYKMDNLSFKITPTANNTILKFTADRILLEGNLQFNSIDDADKSPLAQHLFKLPFVKRILFSANFIAIERFPIVEWAEVQDDVKILMEKFLNGGGLLVEKQENPKRIPVEVYIENTPNPAVMKFVSNKVLYQGGMEFKNIGDSKVSPLASQLFEFPFVKEVFISDNYVSITKSESLEWEIVSPELRSFIKDFIATGKTVIEQEHISSTKTNSGEKISAMTNDDISNQIIQVLEEYIRPAVAADGGNIAFQSYDKDTQEVQVILQGACSGCPSSTITLKNGIEHMLKQLIPGKIGEVVAINH